MKGSLQSDSNTWFTAFVEDKEWQRVADNVLEWRGIRCQLEEKDGFVKREEATQLGLVEDGIVLVAHVTDSRKATKRLVFPNARHNGQALVELMAYVRDLELLSTHAAVQRYRPLRLG